MLTDTHAHLYDDAFDEDRESVVERAMEAGVGRILLPAINSESHERMFGLASRYEGVMFPMMGLHPTSVNDNPAWREELEIVAQYLASPPVARFYGVGEIGLDLYWSKDFVAEQTEAFEYQLQLAAKHDLPVAIHVRDAMAGTVEVLQRHRALGLRGVLHAYSGSFGDYKRIKDCGDFVFGIGGVVTFKNSSLAEVVEQINIEDIVLETDAPYLTPAPHRGKRNESAYVRFVCNRVAELKAMHPREVERITSDNASRIFGFDRWPASRRVAK